MNTDVYRNEQKTTEVGEAMNRISSRKPLAAYIILFALTPFAVQGQKPLGAPRQPVSAQIQDEIVKELTRSGDITSDCLREAGGTRKVINIRAVDLNRDGKTEFIVTLLVSCGAGDGYAWIFRKTSTGLELLLSGGGPRTQISPLRTFTNGYLDIAEDAVGSHGGSIRTIYKFDGKVYRERK